MPSQAVGQENRGDGVVADMSERAKEVGKNQKPQQKSVEVFNFGAEGGIIRSTNPISFAIAAKEHFSSLLLPMI
jgi:hypothetical protein